MHEDRVRETWVAKKTLLTPMRQVKSHRQGAISQLSLGGGAIVRVAVLRFPFEKKPATNMECGRKRDQSASTRRMLEKQPLVT